MTPWQYLALAGLGAFHGLNPGMGWLVALARGVRERSRIASVKALAPIAGGHALAIFAAAFGVAMLRSAVATQVVAVAGGAALVVVGVRRAVTRGRPHLQLSGGQLAGWSFLMSSIHGAGLALLPVLVATPVAQGGHVHDPLWTWSGLGTGVTASVWTGASATAVHTLSMVAVAGVVTLLAFELGQLRILRTFLDLDRVWAFALVGSGVLTVALSLLL